MATMPCAAPSSEVAEILVHQAILSSLQVSKVSQEAHVHPAQGECIVQTEGVMAAMRDYLKIFAELTHEFHTSDFSSCDRESAISLAFNLRNLAEKVSVTAAGAWALAPQVSQSQKTDFCRLVKMVEDSSADIDDLAETWCLSVDPASRESILQAAKDAAAESSNRQVSDWRELLASLQDRP